MKHSWAKKVLVLLRLDIMPGRQELIGIFRYMKQKGCDWDIRLMSPFEVSPEVFSETGSGHFNGVINAETQIAKAAQALAASRLPIVSLDAPSVLLKSRHHQIVFMKTDNEAIAQTVARHFASKGNYNSYAFIHDTHKRPWSQERELAFRKIVGKVHVPKEDEPTASDLSKFLAALPKPSAVFVACDRRAVQILECCRDINIRIPDQLALVSVDNDEMYCNFTSPTITSVEPDFENEGFMAAAELDKLMSKRSAQPAKTIVCAIKNIVERESTTPAAPSAALVRRALAYISANACRRISVEDVVAELGVSRRLADLRFHQLQNKTILETIIDVRLAKVKRLLANTKMSAAAIAANSGFPKPKYLYTLFRRKFGMSMKTFRRERTQTKARKDK